MKSKKIKKQQLLPGIFISLAISFILFIYAPVELYCSNLDEFWFDFGVLMRLALSMFAVSMILMTLGYVILLLIHPVVYRLGLAAGLLLLVCTYVQGNFLIRICLLWTARILTGTIICSSEGNHCFCGG